MRDPFEALSKSLRTPYQVQSFLRTLPYNRERGGETLRSASAALRHKMAHCFEATFIAAAILERHDFPPLIVSFESQDQLDHVIYVFQEKGRWGAIARSRDEGLHGRPPLFKSLRQLVQSYFIPYIDHTGRIVGFQLAHLDELGADWRFSTQNIWRAEQYLIDLPHQKISMSDHSYKQHHKNFLKFGHPRPRAFWW